METKELDLGAVQQDTKSPDTSASPTPVPVQLRVKTAIRAGDIYMQYPRGTNNSTRP